MQYDRMCTEYRLFPPYQYGLPERVRKLHLLRKCAHQPQVLAWTDHAWRNIGSATTEFELLATHRPRRRRPESPLWCPVPLLFPGYAAVNICIYVHKQRHVTAGDRNCQAGRRAMLA